MKRRRINATERDHNTIEELHILIIWLHPTLEISIVNWLLFLRSGNPQHTEFLREVTGQNTFKSPENMPKLPKQMIHKSQIICYISTILWCFTERGSNSSPDSVCIIAVTQCTMLTLCISSPDRSMTYRTIYAFLLWKVQCLWTTCDRTPAPPCLLQFIIVPCRDTRGHNPDHSGLRLTAEKHKEASSISESQRKQKWGLNPEFFHTHPSRKRRLESWIPLSHL